MPDPIIAPERTIPLTMKGDFTAERVQRWMEDVTAAVNNAIVLTGIATPEDAQIASPGRFFVDTVAQTLYFKETGDGDTGWISL